MDVSTPLPVLCPFCAARMPETAAFCPGCGMSMSEPARAKGKIGFLTENIAGALAYVTFIPAIVFLVVKPYSRNVFVRFHSIQCLGAFAAALLFATLLKLAGYVLTLIPMVGPLLLFVLAVLATLAALLSWIVLVVKAAQGEMFSVPWLGAFAEQYAKSL